MNNFPIYGGLTAERFYSLPSHPESDGWQIKARMLNDTAAVEIPPAFFTCDGSTWTLEWPPAQTAALQSGDYTLLLIAVSSAGKELAVDREDIRVIAADATDLRSDVKKTLDAIRATLARKATADELTRSFGGRSIGRMSWKELQDAEQVLARKYAREQNRATGKSIVQTVEYRFK